MKKSIIFIFIFLLASFGFAPKDDFVSLTDKVVTYDKLVSASNTILFVWTTECRYCVQEFRRLKKKCIFFDDMSVFYVNVGENFSVVNRFADSLDLLDCVREKIILDKQGFVTRKFRVSGVPTYLFFKDGNLIHRSYYLDDSLVDSIFRN